PLPGSAGTPPASWGRYPGLPTPSPGPPVLPQQAGGEIPACRPPPRLRRYSPASRGRNPGNPAPAPAPPVLPSKLGEKSWQPRPAPTCRGRIPSVIVNLTRPMLICDDLHKSFGDIRALDGCSFQVRPGKMLGFVGPNGAGKTTAMRAVFGLIRPDSGQVLWEGRPVEKDTATRFGYMPEQRGLYPKMRLHD